MRQPAEERAPLPSRRPRLLVACQPTTGGVAVCVRDLAAAADEQGFQVTVACPSGGDLPGWLTTTGASWTPLPLRRRPAPRDLINVLRLRRLIRQADLVHLHSSKAGAVGRVAIATLGRTAPPCVFTPHGWSWFVGGPPAPLYRGFERWAAPFAAVTVAVSVEEAVAGARILGRKLRRLVVIENGVPLDQYRADGRTAARRSEPLIVLVGRLTKQKGADRAVRALALLPDKRVRLRLVGDGPQRRALRAAARRLHVAERVELVGWTDPRPHLRAADVVVVPSRWEGLSLALLEAMACGAAVVATPAAAPARLSDGLTVTPSDDAALARTLSELLANPPARCALGRRARATVEARGDLSTTIAAHQALWRDLLRCGRGAPHA